MRKVIQNAEMTIETDKPSEGQQKIGVIAEKHGGFVVISESKHNDAASQNVASTLVNVVVRVPAQKFQAALDEIRAGRTHPARKVFRAGRDRGIY